MNGGADKKSGAGGRRPPAPLASAVGELL